ncbi:MAG: hypothetical protein JWL96_2767 [Sphingomonas bacterium]|uniref:hypothetical protein n=1 Tax=Sphingomonas bacterium TaxID=1895847 RepID=UPI002628AAB8|nr:hypothetical protein [Sphingomonas bacterium]MDB5710697.1 hypothetical protein [Sphingomonas bacterium]
MSLNSFGQVFVSPLMIENVTRSKALFEDRAGHLPDLITRRALASPNGSTDLWTIRELPPVELDAGTHDKIIGRVSVGEEWRRSCKAKLPGEA